MTRSEEIAELRRRIELLEAEDKKDSPRWVDATEDHIGFEAKFSDVSSRLGERGYGYSSVLTWVQVDHGVGDYRFCDTTGDTWRYCKVIDPFPLEGEVIAPDDHDVGKLVASVSSNGYQAHYVTYLGGGRCIGNHYMISPPNLRKLWPSERAEIKGYFQYDSPKSS